MERIRWTERSITFQSLVDDPAIKKPVLVQIGTKSFIVGDKFNGQFLMVSPYKVSKDRFEVIKQEFVLSSKHTGLWKVISKVTSTKEDHIDRLTTKDIERIYKEDVQNKRAIPRSYICTKDIEVFELHVRNHDSTIVNGYRIERTIKYIKENVEFQVSDIGEMEYTPTEGERTSQDYVMVPKTKSNILLQFFISGSQEKERLIRNRVLRLLTCTIKNDPHKRCFLLEVNEKPCEIHPIASEGSTQLRYLHSTQNLFNYMLKYGNDTSLYVKLLRGDPPIKSIEFDGCVVLKNTLNGDKVPICCVENRQVMLVNPDLSVKVKLPVDEHKWFSLPEIRTAELQCMQLTLALLTRHESEIYVTVEGEKKTGSNEKQPVFTSRQSSETIKKHTEERERIPHSQIWKCKSEEDLNVGQRKELKSDESKSQTPKLSRATQLFHPASDKFYRNDEKRLLQENFKSDRQCLEQGEKFNHSPRTIISEKLISSPPLSAHHNKSKAKIT